MTRINRELVDIF
ncbi:hypothetical protein LINGRAHAP2_LOCUS1459 [Linum grandiflorum]